VFPATGTDLENLIRTSLVRGWDGTDVNEGGEQTHGSARASLADCFPGSTKDMEGAAQPSAWES